MRKRRLRCPKGFFHDNGIFVLYCSSFSYLHKTLLKKDFSMSDREESVRISRQLHVQETRGCVEKIFGYRHRRTFISFAICSF